MIFVTAGTEKYPFDRLIKAADLLNAFLPDEEVFMQIGTSTIIPSGPHERFMSFRDFSDKVAAARIVISHAGTGALVICANFGKVPIMMARQHALGEHVDDHQQMLARSNFERGRIFLVSNAEELRLHVENYDALRRALVNKASRELTLANRLRELLQDSG